MEKRNPLRSMHCSWPWGVTSWRWDWHILNISQLLNILMTKFSYTDIQCMPVFLLCVIFIENFVDEWGGQRQLFVRFVTDTTHCNANKAIW